MSTDAAGYPAQATSTQDSIEADRAEAEKCRGIFEAAWDGNVGAVQRFLREDPDSVKTRDEAGREPLHEAAENGHVDVVEVLLRAGASVEAKHDKGKTPLHRAAETNIDAIDDFDRGGTIEHLLAAGANVHAVDKEGKTPYKSIYERADRVGNELLMGWLKPVTVHLGFGGNKVCPCNSHQYKTFNGLKDKVENHFGVKIRALVGPKGELLFRASDEDSWKLSPWESKIHIDNGDEITAIVDNPQQEPESDD